MTVAGRAGIRLPHAAILIAIAGAWTLAVAAELLGRSEGVHHDAFADSRLPLVASLLLFLLAWQAMIAAMMLPSSLPLIRLFFRTASRQEDAWKPQTAFVGAYLLVWTWFGAAAFVGDMLVHWAASNWAWLDERSWLIAGSVLVLAGAFQFSSLKEKCLTECRNPGVYMLHHYRRGVRHAFTMGREHGLFCLGCCWALMIVGFAAGVANLWWMVALTAIMVFEKTGKGGDRGVAPIGIGLMALGGLVLLHPSWLPSILGG